MLYFLTSRNCHLKLLLGAFFIKLPKILSILFEILTSDDMQDDASDMIRFLLKYYG